MTNSEQNPRVISGLELDKTFVFRVRRILKGRSDEDVFINLENNNKLVKWISKSTEITENHLSKIRQKPSAVFCTLNPVPNPRTVFTLSEKELASNLIFADRRKILHYSYKKVSSVEEASEMAEQTLFGEIVPVDSIVPFKDIKTRVDTSTDISSDRETLRKPVSDEIIKRFKHTFNNYESFVFSEKGFNDFCNNVLEFVSPKIRLIKKQFEKSKKYSFLNTETVGTFSIATMAAISIGQTSKTTFVDLGYACLLMNIALGDGVLDEDSFKSHPRASYQIVQSRFKQLSDIVSEMVLGHHELFNGKGYPRKVRSDLLAPMVKILSYAVDAYDHMKKAHDNNNNSSLQSINAMYLKATDPSKRRHNLELVRSIDSFMTDLAEV